MNNIFQILIRDNEKEEIPEKIRLLIEITNSKKGGNKHSILNNQEIRQIIGDNLHSSVINAYDKIIPYSYKADLARYCLLYLYGGWYADITVQPFMDIPSSIENPLITFKDAFSPGRQPWDISTAMIYAAKNHAAMKYAIINSIENINSNFYGSSSLSPTGPTVFGRAVALAGDNPNNLNGNYIPLTPNHAIKNYAFVLPNGTILAYGKSTHGTKHTDGLYYYGVQDSNSYTKLYIDKNIYK